MPFFPTLRGRGRQSAASKEIAPASVEQKQLLLADYFNALAASGGGYDNARPWPIERAIREGLDRVIWVFKPVTIIGENTARNDIPFEVVTGEEDNEEVVVDHPVARLLNGKCNPLETGAVFLERLSAQLLLSKPGVFVEVTKSNAGTPIRYDLLPPGRTRIVPGYEALIDHFEIRRLDGTMYTIDDPERVRWIRHPHPTDPYSGMTPLESAGLSIELDYFARLYNRNFMRADGRPGGIVGIKGPERNGGGLNPVDTELLDRQFGRGPEHAGELTIVEGDITYADLAAKPRDSQYQSVSSNMKQELLACLGVPESVMGNASGRTWDNASQEDYTFWSVTMTGHLSRIASGFLQDYAEGERGRFNLNKIEALQHPVRERRKEMREEFAAGLRSAKSYADAAGYGDEIADTPFTRALWLPQGKTPLPTREGDAAALGQGTPVETPAEVENSAPNDGVPGLPAGDDAGGDIVPAEGDTLSVPSERVSDVAIAPATAVSATPAATPSGASAAGESKTLQRKAAAPGWEDVTPADIEGIEERAAADILKVLAKLTEHWTEVAGTRLRAPKTRRGTRHFTPDSPTDKRVGTKALDAAFAADEEAWSDETDEKVRPLIEAAALGAAGAWLTAAGAGAAAGGTAGAAETAAVPPKVAKAITDAVAAVVPALRAGAAWQARRAAQDIADIDAKGGTVEEAVAATKNRVEQILGWAKLAAADAAGAAIEVGQSVAVDHWAKTSNNEVQRQWLSRGDDHVRPTHVKAHGQRRDVDKSFKVGSALLRFPKDPLGPAAETRNCRCRSVWRQKKSGKFVPARSNPAVAS